MRTILKRAQRSTPRFFKKARAVGLTLAGISAAILATPEILPAILVKIAGYLAVAGAVITGMSQVTVKKEVNG